MCSSKREENTMKDILSMDLHKSINFNKELKPHILFAVKVLSNDSTSSMKFKKKKKNIRKIIIVNIKTNVYMNVI